MGLNTRPISDFKQWTIEAEIRPLSRSDMNTGGIVRKKTSPGFRHLRLRQRVEADDRSVVADCIEVYGSLVWGLAKRFTTGQSDAENLTLNIFDDIWRFASTVSPQNESESSFILRIVRAAILAKSSSPILLETDREDKSSNGKR